MLAARVLFAYRYGILEVLFFPSVDVIWHVDEVFPIGDVMLAGGRSLRCRFEKGWMGPISPDTNNQQVAKRRSLQLVIKPLR